MPTAGHLDTLAETALRKALKAQPSLEKRRRLEQIIANLEGTSSAIRFDLDVFSLSLVEHNPGIEATAYGLLADFLRAVQQ